MKNLKNKLEKLPLFVKEKLLLSSQIASRLNYKIYLVGGIVRDLILGRKNLDLDIVVEGNAVKLAEKIAQASSSQFRAHKFFGTATVFFDKFKIDFATARKESYPKKGALPRVSFSNLKDDLFRRDFTINTLAVSLNKENYGKLIDFYNGLSDLKKGLIRVLHEESFLDDPTRIFRAIRFEQRFKFSIEKNTLFLLKEARERKALSWIDEHRIRNEIFLILKEENPYPYLRRINELLGFSFLDPDLKYLKKKDLLLLRRIKKAIKFYYQFSFLPPLNIPIVYLLGIFNSLPLLKIFVKLPIFLKNFGLKKIERKIMEQTFYYRDKIKRLKSEKLDKVKIYQIFKPLSCESIVFYYAYFKDRKIRKAIRIYFTELFSLKLLTKGEDLKRLGIRPFKKYGEYLEKLLYQKIKLGLKTKEEELNELKRLIKKDN